VATARPRAEQVRDLITALTIGLWLTFGIVAVVQLFTSGAKALDSLPPFWFWGIPIAPYTAMYAPWRQLLPGGSQQVPPTPQPPEATL
jgi:hypothetical protein